MSKIFISYRRSDSADVTGRIFDYLSQNFSSDQLFKDVDSIPAGADFRTAITDTVQSCDVAVVIIGRGWLTATNSKGVRRLDDPDDFVRLEIEGALKRKIPIIPVLVGGAEMPPPEALPASLQPLVFRNALPVRPDPDFRNDVGRLVRALRGMIKGGTLFDRIKRPTRLQVVSIIFLLISGLVFLPLIRSYFRRNDGEANQNKPAAGNQNLTADEEPVDDPGSEGEEAEAAPQETTPDKIIPYNPNFLGTRVPLPAITDEISKGDLLNGQVFDYTHYSLVINERRGMPLYTACNIDGASVKSIQRGRDRWMLDARVPRDLQKGDDVYRNNDWDRGHIVPRQAMAWGDDDEAKAGSLAVFFFPNSVPQHNKFNQGRWARLERYILDTARGSSSKVSVFAGPVFRMTDYEYRGSKIPQSFWKIVVAVDPQKSSRLLVSAYLMDQYSITNSGVPQMQDGEVIQDSFDPKTYQISVEKIESLTPLQFGALKTFDTYSKQ